MGSTDEQNLTDHEDAVAVGVLLADAFIARVSRFSPAARQSLLVACHNRLLQGDPEISWLLFCGQPLTPLVEDPPQDDLVPPLRLHVENA